MYAVEILDGRFCYVHKNRHVDSLRALCTARASVLFRRGSSSVLGTLWRLSGRELQQLADSVADVSPLRQVLWRDLAPLYAQSRLHELLLDRLLLTHDDLRALLGAVEPRILTRLRVDKIRCMCQETTTEAGWNLGPDERCLQQRQQDVECLAALLSRAKSLKWLRTDFPVDVDRLAACGPYPSLEHVGLVWIASSASALHRDSLTVRELRVLLAQMPALRELCCDVSQAIGALDSDAEAMAARLEAAQVTHESPAPASPLAPFTPALQLLAALCPNLREVVVRAGRPRDLVPLGRLRHLERLYISYGGTGMHHFLDESLFEALGDAAANLRHLELPTETYIRPQVFVVRPAWKPVALIDACPALESLVARCFFRRHRPAPANDERRSDPSKTTAPPATSSRALSSSLREVELMTMVDASALLPLCPELQRLTLTLSYMNAMEAHAVAELCAEHCPHLQHLTLTVYGGHSHRAVVNLLQRVARIPQVRVFASPGTDVFSDVNANGHADQQVP